ncbi:diguanylate cyclase [Altererythrobacter aquiaggeris]|uniref:sensor domain-containing diguanylate cyclase n=1 Tax=Aestuarierythrobacter aquiaggeris TaxID=1898396 RepID=UPI003017B41F
MVAALAAGVPALANGDPAEIKAQCHAHGAADIPIETMAANRALWDCDTTDFKGNAQAGWLLFDASGWTGQAAPETFFSRITRFADITIAAIDKDGSIRASTLNASEVEAIPAGPMFAADVPQINADTSAVIVKITKPHSVTVFADARLTPDIGNAAWGMQEIALMAFIGGLLIAPLLFDVNFYIVLRERFVLLHAVMIISMIGYLLIAGGLINVFLILPVTLLAISGPLLWAIGVAVSAFFSLEFLENSALTPAMRKLIRASGWWTLIVIGFCALQLDATQSFDNALYFLAFIPVIAIYIAGIVQALLRGSRSARFLAAAWVPIVLAAIDRLLRGIGAYSGPSTLDQLLFLGLGFEVLIITLGVAERFLSLRRERDSALTEAQVLGELSQRDPLTGLMNRRAIEPRFKRLRESGFDTMAVLDLDRFKRINDVHGHKLGDEVLRATASALSGDHETLAIRLGGEEFILLLRGTDTRQRAERLRLAITSRVAAMVPGLDSPITASMGIVEMPCGEFRDMGFGPTFEIADRLLYQAKKSGRNRTAYEKLTDFGARTDRRKDDRRVA